MARRHGWDEATLNNLAKWRDGGPEFAFDEPTRLSLELAEHMTSEPHGVDDALFAALRSHFDEGQMVELASVIGLFNYFNRFNNAFQMQPTCPGER